MGGPFGNAFAILEVGIEDIDRTTKDMSTLEIGVI